MSEAPGQSRPLVLIVDDNTDLLDTNAHILTTRGFDVLVATDGQTAIDICRRHDGRIDALVADLSIPGEHNNFAKAITDEFPTVKVVYATGIPRHIALTMGLVLPEAPFLEKPVDPEMLATLLRGQLSRTPAQRNDR